MDRIQKIILLIVFIFASIGYYQAQTKVFSEAKGSGKNQAYYEFDKWKFSIGKNRYEINKNGKVKRISSRNVVTNFRFKLDKDETLARVVYFLEYKNDLILISEVDIFDGRGSFVIRLDGKTLIPKWQRNIPAFNIAKGVMENNSVYLAAVGFAAKINLETGKYIWKHEDFYNKYKKTGAFNIFETPKIEGNIVTLTENRDNYKRPPNKIKFNKNSGKVIKVTVN
jgi:hypothetical protein